MVSYKHFLLHCLLFLFCFFSTSFADDDKHDDDHKKHGGQYAIPVSNETYQQECGACHFVYQPWLLPSASWNQILADLPSHFGEDVQLDEGVRKTIAEYLQNSAAENASHKRSRKILKSLKGRTPIRVSETPYIQEKHHELSAGIFDRPSIGSLANCVACHTTADQGNFDDDYVKIPK